MSNLLPLNAQARVKRMYRARFVTAFALAIIALSIVFLLALVPSYLAIARVGSPSEAGNSPRNVQDMEAIARAQVIVQNLAPLITSTSTASIYLDAALAAVPTTVRVERIVYAMRDDGSGSLMLVGEASRERVAALRDTLAVHALFRSATVPVSALVGAGTGPFSLTLDIPPRVQQ